MPYQKSRNNTSIYNQNIAIYSIQDTFKLPLVKLQKKRKKKKKKKVPTPKKRERNPSASLSFRPLSKACSKMHERALTFATDCHVASAGTNWWKGQDLSMLNKIFWLLFWRIKQIWYYMPQSYENMQRSLYCLKKLSRLIDSLDWRGWIMYVTVAALWDCKISYLLWNN